MTDIVYKPRSLGITTEAARTARIQKTYSAGDGPVTAPIRRAEPKRPAGVSARQWKKIKGKGGNIKWKIKTRT
jgi:hypothetical protein